MTEERAAAAWAQLKAWLIDLSKIIVAVGIVGGALLAGWSGRGRPTSRMVRDPDHEPQSAEDVARTLPAETWETISWREGSADALSSRFARVRVRRAPRL